MKKAIKMNTNETNIRNENQEQTKKSLSLYSVERDRLSDCLNFICYWVLK